MRDSVPRIPKAGGSCDPPALKELLRAFAESNKTYDENMSFLKPSKGTDNIESLKTAEVKMYNNYT